VPVAAAGLADVEATDADPLVVLGPGEHVFQQPAVRLLDEGALGEGAVGLGEAGRERIADLLQLAEVKNPRRPRGVDPIGNVNPPHPVGDQPRQLTLELADLPAQLGAGKPLIYLDPVKHSRHKQILSRLEGRGGNP
jgi:hypothetical protein